MLPRKSVLRILLLLSIIISILVIPFSNLYFVSCGLDLERERDGKYYQHYYHFQMIGNGTIGFDLSYDPIPAPVLSIDLGGAFSRDTVHPQPKNLWNRLGFWCLAANLVYGEQAGGIWIGFPSWILLLLNMVALTLLRIRARHQGLAVNTPNTNTRSEA